MHVQGSPDAVSGAVAIIKPLAPQGCPRKAVQCQARSAFWEDCLIDSNVSLNAHRHTSVLGSGLTAVHSLAASETAATPQAMALHTRLLCAAFRIRACPRG